MAKENVVIFFIVITCLNYSQVLCSEHWGERRPSGSKSTRQDCDKMGVTAIRCRLRKGKKSKSRDMQQLKALRWPFLLSLCFPYFSLLLMSLCSASTPLTPLRAARRLVCFWFFSLFLGFLRSHSERNKTRPKDRILDARYLTVCQCQIMCLKLQTNIVNIATSIYIRLC